MSKIDTAIIEYENMHGYVDENGLPYNETKLIREIFLSTRGKLMNSALNKLIKPYVEINVRADDNIKFLRISLESKIINYFFDEIPDE